jgi:type I restriction enzyme S subunit
MSWKTICIGDLGKVITGNTPPKKDPEFYGDDYKFIKPTDMDIDARYTTITEDHYSLKAYEKYKKSLIPPLSTCVVTIGSIGKKITLTDDNSFVNQAVNAVIPKIDEYDPFFVFYALKNLLPNVKEADTGASSGRENVSKSNFMSLPLNVPNSLKTQKRIGLVLSSFDDLIENNIKRIKLLEQAAQNIYKEWFVHLRFPGHENIPINEETGLPEGWEEKALGEFTEIKKGKNITKSTIIEGNVPVVAGGLKPAYYNNTPNTINPVITVSASGANAGYVNIYLEDIWASDCSYIDTNLSDSIFFIHNLLSHQQDLIFGMQRGAAQPHVYPKDLKRTEFLIPAKDIIIKFEEQVSPQYKMKRVLLSQNQKLKAARDILLPRLMNRTIEV